MHMGTAAAGLFAEGYSLLERSAEQGEGCAMLALSALLLIGVGREEPDQPRGYSLLEAGVQRGHAESQWALGKVLCTGQVPTVPQDVCRGISLLEAACISGLPEAQHDLGQWLVSGTHFPTKGHRFALGSEIQQNPERGFKLLKAAAVQGHTASEHALKSMDAPGYRPNVWLPEGDKEEAAELRFEVAQCQMKDQWFDRYALGPEPTTGTSYNDFTCIPHAHKQITDRKSKENERNFKNTLRQQIAKLKLQSDNKPRPAPSPPPGSESR